MEKELKIPQISEDADEATVSEILVSEGDTIEKDQSIIAVESDKASVEIPAEFSGKITNIKVSNGDTVLVGDVVMMMETEEDEESSGEDKPDKKESSEEEDESKDKKKQEPEQKADDGADESEQKEKSKKSAEEKSGSKSEDEGDSEESSSSEETSDSTEKAGEKMPVAPLARKLARELGVNLSDVPKSGERLTRQDVTNYVKKLVGESGTKPISSIVDLPDFSVWGETERKPLSGIRKATAKNTTQSWQSIPHVTQHDNANVSHLEDFLGKQNKESDEKVTITAVILKVIGEGLNEFPDFNASLDLENEEVIYKKYISAGVAVDTDKGLLVPVIRDVREKSIAQLATELSDLAQKARDGKLSSKEMKGGNFTISNLGGIGGTSFTPVIFPPQVAILGVSRTETKAAYSKGNFEPKRFLPLSLSYDHRIIDGAKAARFLRWICESLEQPMNLMMH